jgi:hypothetical protein
MKEEQLQLSLSYHGAAVDEGQLDVYDAAANMIAFSDFVTVAGKAVYGSKVEINAKMGGFRQGSFVTDVYFQVVLPTLTLLPLVDVQEVLKTVKNALDVWKHLKGAPPKSVEPIGNGDQINVTNNNGDVIIINRPALTLVLDRDSTAAVERFVGAGLAKPGIDSLEIRSATEALASVLNSEARYFTTVAAVQPVTDNEFEYALTIETAAFKDGNKWRFSDGGSSFYAEIVDTEFLTKIDQGEAFAKGDALRVRMRIEQTRQGQELNTVRTVVKVLEHVKKHQPGKLF